MLTHAEVAKFLVTAFQIPLSDHPVKFADSKQHWGAKWIEGAYEAGVVWGTSDVTFEPDAAVKREDAAFMVWKILSNRGVKVNRGELIFQPNTSE